MIGVVALIFLGPRKLPQIARTIGKMMAEFRNTTNEFKATWQREVDFAEEEEAIRTGNLPGAASETVSRADDTTADNEPNQILPPDIRAADRSQFDQELMPAAGDLDPAESLQEKYPAEPADELSDKRSWL